MYICLCNGVTENQIRDAVSEGAVSLHDLRHTLGVASSCGCCAKFAQQVIEETTATGFDPAVQAI
ncbi:MAG: bacterioferritin-associated ferredoxin [Betaproteobacteria bacterium]|nr:MAG: bacterioferritin-associated ferredoxin [Betaproteobacteria bacterium]